MLQLGPFHGKPACIRIPLGKGVCGATVKDMKTYVVADVDKFPVLSNYLFLFFGVTQGNFILFIFFFMFVCASNKLVCVCVLLLYRKFAEQKRFQKKNTHTDIKMPKNK